MILFRCFHGCLVVFCAVSMAHANDALPENPPDLGFTQERASQHIVVNADGSFVATIDGAVKVNEARAIAQLAQRSLGYNKTLETLDVLQAYTEKPDGRRMTVGPDQIKDQQEARSLAAPMFQDTLVKTVIFPDVAAGDRLVLQYRRTVRTSLFPGYFFDVTYAPGGRSKQLQITYDAPADMALLADAKGFTLTNSPAVGGRKIYRWEYTGAGRGRAERGSVAYVDYGDKLIVSSVPSYAALGKAYESRAQDKSVVTAKIRVLAEQITAALSDPKSKTLALTDWVRKNIRYVAVFVGPGGVVPHAAQSVLDNRYGDCKDHVALLEAMLFAVGIESTGALINAGSAYTLPKVASLGVFNHVITYVPSLNLYLDSTASALAPGYLSPSTVDKPVLLTKTGTVSRTPAKQATSAQATMRYIIAASGDASFQYEQTLAGRDSELNRFVFRQVGLSDRKLLVERLLQQRGQKGSGAVDVGEIDSTLGSYQYGFSGRIDNLLALPGPVSLPAASGLLPGILQTVTVWTAEKQRTQNYACFDTDQQEEISFELPADVTVLSLPKGVVVNVPDLALNFTSSYSQSGQTVIVKRSLRFDHAGVNCTPRDFDILLPALTSVVKDLRGQVIVQNKS